MLSQGLLERYLLAAQKISVLATGAPVRATVQTYKILLALVQADRVSEDLPLGSRGGAAIRHQFPLVAHRDHGNKQDCEPRAI
jgi:hypothetical protein